MSTMRVLSFDCGVSNLAWCVYSCARQRGDDQEQARILDWQVVDLRLPNNKLQPVCEILISFLEQKSIKQWLHLEEEASSLPSSSTNSEEASDTPICHVVIEKQPSRNSQAKAVESCLYNYFLIRGKFDADRAGDKMIDRICIYSAKHKLAGQKILRGKRAYRERKLLSIDVASKLTVVRDSVHWSRYLDDLHKKDDACDALLQAVAYVKRELQEGTQRDSSIPRVIARKPKTGVPVTEFTEANCKYVLKKWLYPRLRKDRVKALELLPDKVKQVAELEEKINETFGDLNTALRRLKL